MRTQATRGPGVDPVVVWRREQLVQSGLPSCQAASLAKDTRYDLHALIELVERGCPPRLAIRILAPLDGGDAT
jgi:hypothetical protein